MTPWASPFREFVSVGLAATRLGVSEGLIRVWIHRYKVERKGSSKHGRIYDFQKLVDIEHDTRTSPKARRCDRPC